MCNQGTLTVHGASEDCGAHYGEDTELGHARRELFAELGEVGARAAAAAAAAAASAASAAAPTETPPRPKRARKSIQRFYPVQAERGAGGGGCRPLYPKFSAPPAGGRTRPRRPLFLIWHRYLPTYWDFECPGTSLGGAAEHLGLSSRALPRPAPLDELLHEPSVPVVARGGEGVCRQWQSLGGPPFAVLRSVASAAALGRPLPLGSARVPEVAS